MARHGMVVLGHTMVQSAAVRKEIVGIASSDC